MTTILTRLAAAAGATTALMTLAALPATAKDQPEPDRPTTVVSEPYAPAPADQGLDVISAALGALGGIAFAGAGLGITLSVQRRRDRTAPRSA